MDRTSIRNSILAALALLLGSSSCVTIDPWETQSASYDKVRDHELDLRGMTAKEVERSIGYPKYRATLSSKKGRGRPGPTSTPKKTLESTSPSETAESVRSRSPTRNEKGAPPENLERRAMIESNRTPPILY